LGLSGFIAVKFVLNPIFSAFAKDSSVVPVFEHSSLKFKKFLSFYKILKLDDH
jgi:hypothetical protein